MSYETLRTNPTILFFICCQAYIANGLLSVLPSSSLPILAKDTNVSLSTAGFTFTISALGTILAVLLSNFLVNKIGTRPIIIIGLGGLISSSILMPITRSFDIWLVAELLQGMSAGFISIGLMMTLSLNFGDQLGEKLNMLHGSMGIGSLLAPMLLSFTLPVTQSPVLAFALVAADGALCLLALNMLSFTSKQVMTEEIRQPQQAERGTATAGTSMQVLKHALFWLMALQICLYVGTESGFSSWLVSSVSQSDAITLQKATPAATLFWIGLTLGRILVAQLIKYGYINNTRLLYISIIGGGISGILATTFMSIPLLCFISCFWEGFFIGPIFPSVQAIATRRFSQAPALISSMVMISSGVAGMTIPMSIGDLMPLLGIRGAMFIPGLLCLLISVPFYLGNKREHPIVAQSVIRVEPVTAPLYELATIELPRLEVSVS
ncbi:MAG TPA: MFS transporter [Ktedonobacteraceae bacterium]|jgi:fucose permease|nr:MFS transporter [Ktedonobacteraceae bacterium]